MKKFICVCMAVLQFLLLTACNGDIPFLDILNPTEPEKPIVYVFPSEVPTFDDDKELPIIAFWSPPNTEEWYQSMVDCGFTDVIIDSKYGVIPGSEKMFETLGICDKVGIGAYIAINRGQKFTTDLRYGQYESFKGINTDEPLTRAQIDIIIENIAALKGAFPEAKFWLGLAFGYPGDFASADALFDYYMTNGGTQQEAFSLAPYPLSGIEGAGILNHMWLSWLEDVAAYADKYDTNAYSYMAAMSIRSQKGRRPDTDDFRFTSYVPLAFGIKGLGHFCYTTPGTPPYAGEFAEEDYALINFTNVNHFSTYYKTELWDKVKTVNEELKGMDQAILSFDWQGIMKSIGTDAQTGSGRNCFLNVKKWMHKHDGIKSFTSTEDTLMGVFKNDDGYDGFMLVNFADPAYDRENTVNLEFRGATHALVYIEGKPQMVDLPNGSYTVTLKSGEGQFIIPLS